MVGINVNADLMIDGDDQEFQSATELRVAITGYREFGPIIMVDGEVRLTSGRVVMRANLRVYHGIAGAPATPLQSITELQDRHFQRYVHGSTSTRLDHLTESPCHSGSSGKFKRGSKNMSTKSATMAGIPSVPDQRTFMGHPVGRYDMFFT